MGIYIRSILPHPQSRLTPLPVLQGHHLWNASQTISKYLQKHAETLIYHKNVLELGAGAGLPSLVAAFLGARKVVVTDYPDSDLIANLKHNVDSCALVPDLKSVISAQASLGLPFLR